MDTTTTKPESLLTIRDVCATLSVGRTTVWQLRRQGKLPAVQIGSAVRFRRSDVEALIQPENREVPQ